MSYRSYFVRKRARFKSAAGKDVNIPFGTILEADESGFLQYDGEPLSYSVCDNARNYFVQNDDNQGQIRAELVNRITKELEKRYSVNTPGFEKHQNMWKKVWEDETCNRYRRKDHEDHWLWDQEFFNAPICDLVYIAKLLNISVKGCV